MTAAVDVGYQYVYDLYYRTRHACLASEVYRLEFLEWVKAGLAYNTRGIKDPTRKIAYFGQLYHKLQRDITSIPGHELAKAVTYFYDDLFQLYQDHLEAQLKEAGKQRNNISLEPHNLVLLPSFEQTPEMITKLPVAEVVLAEYECENVDELRQRMATLYVVEGSLLFRGMGLMFDYGVWKGGKGVILEVR